MSAAFIAHTLAHAVAAFSAAAESGQSIVLLSPPHAVRSLGAEGWLALIAQARSRVPAAQVQPILDCADAPGLALAALRVGAPAIRLRARPEVQRKVADIAAFHGASLIADDWPDALDLEQTRDPLASARVWLRG